MPVWVGVGDALARTRLAQNFSGSVRKLPARPIRTMKRAQQDPIFLVQSQYSSSQQNKADLLYKQGEKQFNARQFQAAIQSWQEVLKIYRKARNRVAEAYALGNLGTVYLALGQPQNAIDLHEQSLEISRNIRNRHGEAWTLRHLGDVHSSLYQYQEAISFYRRSLALVDKLNDPLGEADSLLSLGNAHFSLSQYGKAASFYEESLAIHHEIGNYRGKAASLGGLGNIYLAIGQAQKGVDYYQESLAIARKRREPKLEAKALGNIGTAYHSLGKYAIAIEFHKLSLAIGRKIRDRRGEAASLGNLGNVHFALEQYDKDIVFHEQALAIYREIRDRTGEADSLGNMGRAYAALGKYTKAIDFHSQSLAIDREIGDSNGEGLTLSNLGILLAELQQPELGIVVLKQSVNVRESIRRGLQDRPQSDQKSFSDSISNDYRYLADLLLQQNRILEAQAILDLLKVQELDEYLSDVRGSEKTSKGIDQRLPEQDILTAYAKIENQLITLGKERRSLSSIPIENRTPKQKDRLKQLRQQEQLTRKVFRNFYTSKPIQAKVAQLRQTTVGENIEIEQLNDLRDNLRNLNQNAVLLYPLILNDRLELILVSPDAPPIRRTSNIRRADLNHAIFQMRAALKDPSSNATLPAQQLYQWLIKPLENDLKQAGAETILYAPDGQLRYIPLAALHDGKQWLAQRLRINNITAASLDDLNQKSPAQNLKVLAAAFTEGRHEVSVGNKILPFEGLPFAATEVANLAQLIPNTTQRLNDAFKLDLVFDMNDYGIVHLATHAAFQTGQPEDSFILFGDGNRATLTDIKDWSLPDVDLVVLSACDTGVGDQLGNGEEILGFGYLMQQAGAKATIASLWSVSDGGTQVLMNTFYDVLKLGKVTKAEALRQAQVALIHSQERGKMESRGGIQVKLKDGQLPKDVKQKLSHPYYWAPFILIGNGL